MQPNPVQPMKTLFFSLAWALAFAVPMRNSQALWWPLADNVQALVLFALASLLVLPKPRPSTSTNPLLVALAFLAINLVVSLHALLAMAPLLQVQPDTPFAHLASRMAKLGPYAPLASALLGAATGHALAWVMSQLMVIGTPIQASLVPNREAAAG